LRPAVLDASSQSEKIRIESRLAGGLHWSKMCADSLPALSMDALIEANASYRVLDERVMARRNKIALQSEYAIRAT